LGRKSIWARSHPLLQKSQATNRQLSQTGESRASWYRCSQIKREFLNKPLPGRCKAASVSEAGGRCVASPRLADTVIFVCAHSAGLTADDLGNRTRKETLELALKAYTADHGFRKLPVTTNPGPLPREGGRGAKARNPPSMIRARSLRLSLRHSLSVGRAHFVFDGA
jgi:hypothetical protein